MAKQKKPNLFSYATSELSQDTFLCWLFEHLALQTNDIAYSIAERLLQKIVSRARKMKPDFQLENLLDYSLKIERQVHHIDVLLRFQSQDDSEKVYIMIEDKTDSGESRKNQLEHYQKKLRVNASTDFVIPVLFKTGYATKKERENFAQREIIFIGYEDIFNIFSPFIPNLQDDVILHSWWLHFNKNYYKPIKGSKSLSIKDTMSLDQWNCKVRNNKYVHKIVFNNLV